MANCRSLVTPALAAARTSPHQLHAPSHFHQQHRHHLRPSRQRNPPGSRSRPLQTTP
ncbi:hypothetical protein DL95DRAFT_397741 [Leptodontidium sp. 2 PMI_412]|nr:hypothetical protein DL95DRAFT_397741 [Leptodontidium sp. 2 PMI_412]